MTRAIFYPLTTLVLTSACVATIARRPADVEAVYPYGEAVAVYRTVLDTLYGLGERPPVIVLYDSTQLRVSTCQKNVCTAVPPHKSSIESSTLRDFENVTIRHRVPIRADFGNRLPIVLLSFGDQPQLSSLGEQIQFSVRDRVRPDEQPFWVGFQRRYPGTWGITDLSQVGFNSRRTQALVQVHHGCGDCASWEDMLLEKRAGRWNVVERIPIPEYSSDWIRVVTIHTKDSANEYQILGPLRYLGKNAHRRAEFLRQQDSARIAKEDSLARERAPTRIRGTVILAKTGLPFRNALVISHNAPNDVKQRTIADSAGRFVFNNLRGGTMLEVRCPGAPDDGIFTVAAPGLYAHAAIDTVVEISVSDLNPCWSSHHVRPIQPGWIESAEARSAIYPMGAAAKVYRAALDLVLPSSVKKIGPVVISNRTSAQCVMYSGCGGPQLRRLIAEGVVDEETARDFVRANRSSVVIRTTFEYRRPTRLMTREDSLFLATQAAWVFRTADYNSDFFWMGFRDAFSNSAGIVSLSRVGFNRDSTQALVEVRLDSATRYYRPFQMLLFKRKGSDWQIARRHIEREVTSGDVRGRRCVPVTAPRTTAPTKNALKLQGDFVVTEVITSRNDTIPRRIHIHIAPGKLASSVAVISDSTEKRDASFAGALYISKEGARIWLMSPPNGLDGYVNELHILRMKNGQFFGSWQSSFSYVFETDSARHILPNPSGDFCAVPIFVGEVH